MSPKEPGTDFLNETRLPGSSGSRSRSESVNTRRVTKEMLYRSTARSSRVTSRLYRMVSDLRAGRSILRSNASTLQRLCAHVDPLKRTPRNLTLTLRLNSVPFHLYPCPKNRGHLCLFGETDRTKDAELFLTADPVLRIQVHQPLVILRR